MAVIERYFRPQTKDPEVGDIIVKMLEHMTAATSQPEINSTDIISGYDIPDFTDDFIDLIKEIQTKTDMFKDLSIKPAFVFEDVGADEGNAIRFKTKKRFPATLTQGARIGEGILDHKWLLTDIIEDKMNPGYKALIYRKQFDNILEISSWSKNFRDADRVAYILEDIFESYGYLFKLKGLHNIRFEGRQADEFREVSNILHYGIPLHYYLRTQKVKLVYEKILENITIEFMLHKDLL